MQNRRQRQTGGMTVKTPLCRICGAPDPRPVDVPGGTLCMCPACLELMGSGRLDVKIERPAAYSLAGSKVPAYGSPLVMASYDGGRWNKVSYSNLVAGRKALAPVATEEDAKGLYRAMVNATAKRAKEAKERAKVTRKPAKAGAPARRGPKGRAVLVDGETSESINEAARRIGCSYSQLYTALNYGRGECCGHEVGYADGSPGNRVEFGDARGRGRAVAVGGTVYPSMAAASRATGISIGTIRHRLETGKTDVHGLPLEAIGGNE